MFDSLDHKILTFLESNSRASFAEIGRTIGLSPSSTRERVKRMEDIGVIKRYMPEINYKLLGYDLEAFILIKVFHGKLKPFLQEIKKFGEIKQAHRITGNHNVHVTALLTDQLHLQSLIDRLMVYGDTETLLVLSKIE